MKQINYKKLIIPNIPYVFFVYLFDKVGQAVRLAPGADISAKILNITQGFSAAFENALPSVYPLDLLVGIVGAVIIRLIVYVKGKNAKKYRKGAEYGSARWGNAEDIKPYIDPDFQNNIILTQTERLTMNSRPKQPKYARNKNVVVIGGSGSGKTRFFVKPNLMQLHSSYVLTDPKGTVLIECGKLLQRAGYRIKVLNTINFKKSMHYNPFVYIRSEKDILKLVNTLIANTKGEGEKSAEDFWVKAERLLYCALVGYIWYEAPAEEMNFITLLELINASEAREDDEEYQSPVDLLFADLEERDPDHFAVKQYRKYKLAAGKTRAMRPLSGEKGAKRCDSRHFCTVIVSNQLIISRKVREIIMKIGAYCRNRRPICPIRPNDHAAILAVPTSATAASTARGIAKNGVTTLSAAARLRGGTMRAGKGREKFFCPGIPCARNARKTAY